MARETKISASDRLNLLEQNLKDRTDKLNSILSAAPVGIGLVVDRVLTEVNPFFCDMIGYTPEEMLGKSSRLLYPSEEEFSRVGTVKYQQIDKQGRGSVETRFLRKDGEIIHVLLSSVPLEQQNPSAGVIFTVLDISGKKKAEQDLELSFKFEQIITGISTRFINLPSGAFDKALVAALQEICEFTNMDRGAILLLSKDESISRYHCLYSKKDDPLNGYDIPPIATEKMQWWLGQLKNNEIIRILSLDELPKSETYQRKLLEAAGVKSMLNVPIMDHGRLMGHVEFANTKEHYIFPERYNIMIRVFAEIVANALEKVKMEQALETSENISSNLIKTSPMGILIYRLDDEDQLILTAVNPATEKILEREYSSSIGKSILELFPNLAETEIPQKYRQVARTGKSWSTTDFLYEDDVITGAYDVLAFQISPGQVAVMFSDITHRKQTEQQLQQSEEKHRKIFQNIQDVYFEMAPDSTILEVSPSLSKISKFNRDELIGQSIQMLVVDEKIKNVFMGLLFKRGELLDFDIPLKDKDGRMVYCSVNVKTETNTKGEIVKVIGSLRDITERRMAREKISKLERAVEQSPSSVVITDLEGNIEYVNPKFCEITGYSREDAIGKNPSILKSGKQDQSFYDNLWCTISSGKEWRGEFHNKKKDGSTFWEMASISPVRNSMDEITHYIAIKEDITDRKKWEEELQQAKEKAEQSDHLKSAFLANMSHEIRTPMNAILGFSELLKHDDIKESDRREYVNLISTKGNDLMMIISDLIDISRIESGDMQLASSNIRVNELITEVFDQTHKEKDIREKDLVQIRKRISEREEPIIQSDKHRLRQVFTNLLSNALKFTQQGFVEIGYELKDDLVQFYVKDTGIGIASDKQEIIFERFRQADDSTTRKYGGTGLGLSISRQIIGLLGGNIWVESTPGQGSTFWFTIPVKEIEKKNTGLPDMSEVYAEQDLNLENRTILIAEDDPSNYLFLESLLGPTKAEVIWARDGNQAIEMHKNAADLDLILMDIRMPGLNGLLATERIRKVDQKIPIIALTAFAFADDRMKSQEAGCNEHLTKPVKVEELKYHLAKYLRPSSS